MAAQLEQWPIKEPAIAGDDLAFTITLNSPDDLTGAEFVAVICEYPGGPEVARWQANFDEATKVLTLNLPAAESVKCDMGQVFDVRQTAPTAFTWLTVRSFNIEHSHNEGPLP